MKQKKSKFQLGMYVKVDKSILETEHAKGIFSDSYRKLTEGTWEIVSTTGKHHEEHTKRLDCFKECWPVCYVEDKYLIILDK